MNIFSLLVMWWFDDENEPARIEGLVAWLVIQLRTNLVGIEQNFLTEEDTWEKPFWWLEIILCSSCFNPMWPLGIDRLLVISWLRWFLSRHLSETKNSNCLNKSRSNLTLKLQNFKHPELKHNFLTATFKLVSN